MKDVVIVKIGTAAASLDDGQIDTQVIWDLAEEISNLRHKTELDFIIVTSGAVGTGRSAIGNKDLTGPETLAKQVLAAVGQPLLMACYAQAFAQNGFSCGQILLTRMDLLNDERRETLWQIIATMLENGIIPIINENDALTSEELRNAFTDNDQLSALISELIQADKLIVLSDVDGFYDGSPHNTSSKVISIITDIGTHKALIDDTAGNGRGGMRSKLETAETVTANGTAMYIANGKTPRIITDILSGVEKGTYFPRKVA